jgi:hypothetical protein
MRRPVLFLALVATACGPSGERNNNGTGSDAIVPQDAAPGRDGQVIYWDGGVRDGMVGCNPQSFTLEQAPPPAVLLVLDRSGSMTELGSTGATRWEEMNQAVELVLTQFEAQVKFGLLMYPTGNLCQTPPAQVGPDLHHLAPILHELDNATPSGGTPTAAALRNAGQTLNDMAPADTRFIILATDGGPNCNYGLAVPCTCTLSDPSFCCTSYPSACTAGHFCLDETAAQGVLSDLHSNQGIGTFVIGLDGTQEYVEVLNDMAVAGGWPQQGGATDYYAATSQAELVAALQAIAGSVISCSIALQEAPEFPSLVKVYVDGGEVPRDGSQQNGWDYTDASLTQIMLYGAACENLQNGEQHNVTATFACEVN